MERLLYQRLKKWKESPDRKPLILEGARQVGKTWLLQQFGRKEYKNCVYINCDNNPNLQGLFEDYVLLYRRYACGCGYLSENRRSEQNQRGTTRNLK